jgi:hypothetical protein
MLTSYRRPLTMQVWLLHDDRPANRTRVDVSADERKAFSGIRCPRCRWRPSPSSRWCCDRAGGSPEPFFEGCGTAWNTFATRGRCPGCHHQWQWTSCLRCHEWSLHVEWYETDASA